jgi:sugar phosphate isomerase/epimerase
MLIGHFFIATRQPKPEPLTMSSFSRRHFLHLAGLTALSAPALRAIEPIERTGAPRLRLGLAAYSFRDYFKDMAHPRKAGVEPRLEMRQFIDYCAEQGCDGAELTSYYFPKDVTDEQLRIIRRHAFLKGVSISGTSVGNNFARKRGPELDKEIAEVKRWIDRAAILGAPHVRVFAGPQPKDAPLDEAKRNCIAALVECCAYAGERGIFLGLENHGGIVAEPEALLEIVRAIKSPWFGINLDTGNFHTADPYASLAQCAPYAVNVQVKVEMRAAGDKQNQPADLPRLVKILRDSNYQGWVTLEYESPEDPWKAVPPILAQLKPLLGTGAANAAPKELILFDGNTLNGWKVTDYGARGEVTVKDGQIVIDAGDPLTGINLAGEPPARMNYEISLDAMKLDGDDFFCALTVPVGQSFCTLVVGGWGGSLVGISNIDEMDASENFTTQFRKFISNRWYRIRLRVTAKKLEAWIDDEQLVDADIEGKKISMRLGEIEMSQPLGITTFRTRSAVRDIKLRTL